MDSQCFSFLNPPMINGVLAHEVAHKELGHIIPGSKPGIIVSREFEFAADKRATEITREPLALAEALTRMDSFNTEIWSAVPVLKGLNMVGEVMTTLAALIKRGTWKDAFYPSTAERVGKLESFAKRIEKGAYELGENGQIRL